MSPPTSYLPSACVPTCREAQCRAAACVPGHRGGAVPVRCCAYKTARGTHRCRLWVCRQTRIRVRRKDFRRTPRLVLCAFKYDSWDRLYAVWWLVRDRTHDSRDSGARRGAGGSGECGVHCAVSLADSQGRSGVSGSLLFSKRFARTLTTHARYTLFNHTQPVQNGAHAPTPPPQTKRI